MTDVGIPTMGRVGFHSPVMAARMSSAIAAGNVSGANKTALEKASIGMQGGFENYTTPFVPSHTVGVATGTRWSTARRSPSPTWRPRTIWSQTLNTDGWTNSTTGILKAGDTFTIAGVYSIHPGTKVSTGRLQTFSVLADANPGRAPARRPSRFRRRSSFPVRSRP